MTAPRQYELWQLMKIKYTPKRTEGIKPVAANLRRLFEAEVTDLPRLLACDFAPEGLKAYAIANQPERVEARKADLISAMNYELNTFGYITLKPEQNPYHQPQRRTL